MCFYGVKGLVLTEIVGDVCPATTVDICIESTMEDCLDGA